MPMLRRRINTAVAQKAASKKAYAHAKAEVRIALARHADAERASAFAQNPTTKRNLSEAGSRFFGEKINLHLSRSHLANESSNYSHEVGQRKSFPKGLVRRLKAIGDKPNISLRNQKRLQAVKGSKLLGANKK